MPFLQAASWELTKIVAALLRNRSSFSSTFYDACISFAIFRVAWRKKWGMLDSVLMRSIVRWPDMLVCTYLAFCALRIFDSARKRKWKWEGVRERERGLGLLEIGRRDREEIERWSAKRVFTLQRNQSALRLMVAIIAII